MTILSEDKLLLKEAKDAVEELAHELKIEDGKVDVSFDNPNVEALVQGKDRTMHLIIKSLPPDCEKFMYTKVLPRFVQFFKEKRVLDPYNCFPKYYKSTKNGNIVIEDIKEKGFKKKERLDYEHVVMVIREFAKIHAIYFAFSIQKPKESEELLYGLQGDLLLKAVKHDENRKYLDKLLPLLDTSLEGKMRYFRDNVLNTDKSHEHCVVVHGGASVKNLLFNYQKHSTVPSEVCFSDWETARIGSPALDLAFFLFTSTDREFRLEHYEFLLQLYYGSLSTYLHLLDCNPAKVFPYSTLQEHMKKYSVYVFYMLYYVVGTKTGNDEEFNESKMAEIIQDFSQFHYF